MECIECEVGAILCDDYTGKAISCADGYVLDSKGLCNKCDSSCATCI